MRDGLERAGEERMIRTSGETIVLENEIADQDEGTGEADPPPLDDGDELTSSDRTLGALEDQADNSRSASIMRVRIGISSGHAQQQGEGQPVQTAAERSRLA